MDKPYAPSALLDGHFSMQEIALKIDFAADFLTRHGYFVGKHYLGSDCLPDKLVIEKTKRTIDWQRKCIEILHLCRVGRYIWRTFGGRSV